MPTLTILSVINTVVIRNVLSPHMYHCNSELYVHIVEITRIMLYCDITILQHDVTIVCCDIGMINSDITMMVCDVPIFYCATTVLLSDLRIMNYEIKWLNTHHIFCQQILYK